MKRDPNSIERYELSDRVREHAKHAPIGANRALAYTNAFFQLVRERADYSCQSGANDQKAFDGGAARPLSFHARTKNESALRVPLSPLARTIIKSAIASPLRPTDSKLVFSTTGDMPVLGFGGAKWRLDKAIQ